MRRSQNNKILSSNKGKRYFSTTKYPTIPLSINDIYVNTTQGDRLDILAQQYYQDSSLWWIISSANSALLQNSYYIPEGQQIRIPQNITGAITNFNALNER